jgi:Cytochrome P450
LAGDPRRRRRALHPGDSELRRIPDHSCALQRTMPSSRSLSTTSSYAHLHALWNRTENPGVGGSIPSLPTTSQIIPSVSSATVTPLRSSPWLLANRDPEEYPEPDRFDITRQGVHHRSFGGGAHFSLGAPLARLEAQLAIAAFFQRFPRIRLADEVARVARVPRVPRPGEASGGGGVASPTPAAVKRSPSPSQALRHSCRTPPTGSTPCTKRLDCPAVASARSPVTRQ